MMSSSDQFNPLLFHSGARHTVGLTHTHSVLSFISSPKIKLAQSHKKIEKKIISIQQQYLDTEMQIYNWRSKTQLPVSKVFFYKIISKNQNSQQYVPIQVSYEAPIQRIGDLTRLPLFQILYLMKESLIGFERLFCRFGSFVINKQMIYLNKNNKCKVWVNIDLARNYPLEHIVDGTQQKFLLSIIRVFEEQTIKSRNSMQFYGRILSCQKIIQAIEFVDKFAKENRIIISNFIPLNSTFNPSSPNKMTLSKYYDFKQPNQSIIFTEPKSLIKHKYSLQTALQFEQALQSIPNKLGIEKRVFPKFLSKKSQEFTIKNKHDMNSQPKFMENKYFQLQNDANTDQEVDVKQNNNLSKSKSQNNFKLLKQSTFNKIEKNKFENDSNSNNSSISPQITTRSFKTLERFAIPTSSLRSPRKPNDNNRKEKSDVSFRKDSECFKNQEGGRQRNCMNPQSKSDRQRKYSNDIILSKGRRQYLFKGIKILSQPSINEHDRQESMNISLQKRVQRSPPEYSDIFMSNSIKININNPKCSFQTSQSITNIDQCMSGSPYKNNLEPFGDIFEKNGWKMQIAKLLESEISLRESIKEGKQERSDMLGSTMDYVKLGRLGRTIEGSMTPDDEFLNQE